MTRVRVMAGLSATVLAVCIFLPIKDRGLDPVNELPCIYTLTNTDIRQHTGKHLNTQGHAPTHRETTEHTQTHTLLQSVLYYTVAQKETKNVIRERWREGKKCNNF